MASQSAAPPNSPDGNTQNPAAEAVQPTANDHQDANTGVTKDTSVFVNTEPVREEQVQNAVKFLSHPKVKGSPVIYRRSFLERKGLTKEEIDEAFHRVPDESPSLSTTQPAVTNQGGPSQPSSNIQPQVATQSLQPVVAAPVGPGTMTASRFHWSHAFLAIGVLAISGAGTAVVFKNAVVPRLKSWIRKVVLENEEEGVAKITNAKPTLAEEAAAAAKAAAAAASNVARASQEMLISKAEEKRYFGELMSLLDLQVQEMKSMSNSIRKLEGQSNNSGREGGGVQVTSSRVNSQPPYANGRADHYDSRSVRSLLPPPASVEPSTAPPYPRSYAEPWEASSSQVGSTYPQENSNGLNPYVHDNRPGSVYQSNGDGSLPWWQQKNSRITEVEPNNESTMGFPGGASERPIQRSSWVPPQPPPVAMAEAAVAIRQPKKLPVQKEQQRTDEQSSAHSTEVTDELQRVTKMSESGGTSDVDAGSSVTTNTSEIQREEDVSYPEA